MQQGCSTAKLHMIFHAISTDNGMDKLYEIIKNDSQVKTILHYDPSVNRVILFAVAEHLILQNQTGTLNLTPKGFEFVEVILGNKDLLSRKKTLLTHLGKKLTDAKIKDLFTSWRSHNASNK